MTLQIDQLPHDTAARIEWDTTATSWKIEPMSGDLKLSQNQIFHRIFEASYATDPQPLPTATLIYPRDDGEVRIKLSITVSPPLSTPATENSR